MSFTGRVGVLGMLLVALWFAEAATGLTLASVHEDAEVFAYLGAFLFLIGSKD